MGKLSTTGYRSRGRLADKFRTMGEEILALGPLGYWPLNETSGTTATDRSGNGRNGTYTGTGYALANIAGPDGGNYVNLDYAATNNSGYVVIADNNVWSLNNASGLTFFGCIRTAILDTQARYIVGKGNTSNFEYGWANNVVGAGRMFGVAWNSTGTTIRSDITDNQVVGATGVWYAVGFYSASPTTNSAIELRLNSNTEISPCTKANNTTGYSNGTADLILGYRADLPAASMWRGGLAHFAVFAGQVNLSTVFAAADREGWF